MNKKWTIVTIAALLLIAGVGWAASFLGGGDPQIAELEQMRDEAFQRAEGMPDDQRRAQHDQFRDKIRGLSEDQRRQFFEKSSGKFQQFALQRMNDFFAKSPEEQRQSLDQMIDRMEQRRKQGGAEGRGGDGRGGGRPDMTPQQRDQRRKQGLDRTTPEMRGMMDAFRDMINDRRKERGMEPIHGRPHWGHR
jgi:hypothetical protein